MAPPKPPRDVMWTKPAHADNYVGDGLRSLLTPAPRVPPPAYAALVWGVLPVVERLVAVAAGLLCFVAISRAPTVPAVVLGAAVSAAAGGAWAALGASGVLVLALLALLSPVLHELTASFEDDAVAGWVGVSLLVHVATFRYHDDDRATSAPGGPLSLNAAVFASCVLASRLPAEAHVMLLLVASLGAHVLAPVAAGALRAAAPRAYAAGLVGAAAATCAATDALVGRAPATALAVLLVAVGGVAPALFRASHGAKLRRPGPWDLAHVPPEHRDAHSD